MKSLESLLEQEHLESKSRLEICLPFCLMGGEPNSEPQEPLEIPFELLNEYADNLNEQYGIPPPIIESQTPQSEASLETFGFNSIQDSLSNPYQSLISEEELAYANHLSQQFNAPSSGIEPVAFLPPEISLNFDPNYILDVANNPIGPSLSTNSFSTLYSNENFTPSPDYIKPNPEIIKPNAEIFKPNTEIFSPSQPIIPEKKYFDDFNQKHTLGISGFKDMNPVYDLFKNNEFPKLYDKFSQGMNLGKNAVKSIIFTNPLKNCKDLSPSFTPCIRELRFPAIKPKSIPFDDMSQNNYNKLLKNAFLPHELGHVKINEEYHKSYPDIIYEEEFQGFNEHLANTFALDSVKNTSQFFETNTGMIEFEKKWVAPLKELNFSSPAGINYDESLANKDKFSFIPGKQATINMFNEPVLKQKYDWTLNQSLDFKYGDDPYKETVYNNINKLSNLYQDSANKLLDISKKNCLFSEFKVKNILSEVRKETFDFMEHLK